MIDLALLNSIINVWDPADLMTYAPSDEYSSYSKKLYDRIHSDYQIETVKEVLTELYEEEFGDSGIHMRTCEYVAQLICLVANIQHRT